MNGFLKGVLWKGWLVALLIGVLLVPAVQSQATEGRMLRYGYEATDLKTLDPHGATGSQDRIIAEMVFNGLVRFPPGNLSADAIEPDLAVGWHVSSDGREWTFYLDRNVMWHPYGDQPSYELTSEDVVYSFQKASDPKRSAFSGTYDGMTFGAVDRYTVRIALEKPVSSFLFLPKVANRGGGLIVCKRALEEKGDQWFKTHPVGTGPFVFKSYTPMEKVVLVRNQDYFRSVPKLAGIEWFYMPDMSSAELALQKGEVDLIKGPREQAWGEKVEKIPRVVVDSIGNPETFVAHFNMSVKPLDLLKVRQAMAHAVNQKEFVAVYGEKVAEPIYSAVPVGRMISGMTKEECAEENVLYEFNLGKAKELLVEAGYPDGFSLNVFTSESSVYKRAYELLQAQLRKIGIEVKLSVVDHSTFHARIRQNLNPIVVYVCTRPNPDIILTQFYHSGSIVVKGRKPITNFSHLGEVDADGDGAIDSIDDLIEAARIELDSARQVKLWREAQKKILKYAAAVPIINAGYLYARHRYVDYGYEHVTVADGVKPTENTRILEKK